MTKYLKAMKSLSPHSNPFKSFRLPTKQEKEAKLLDRVGDLFTSETHVIKNLKRAR